MSKLREIKNRISNVSKIRKVTSALETVATTRLKKQEQAVLAFRPYASGIKDMFVDLSNRARTNHPLMSNKKPGLPSCIIAITSDKGLCGAFNENIYSRVRSLKGIKLISIGKKGTTYFKKKGLDIISSFVEVNPRNIFELTSKITQTIIDLFTQGQISQVRLLFNRFRLHLLGKIEDLVLLPVREDQRQPRLDFIYEPNSDLVLDKIIPSYIQSQIHGLYLESRASEEMARMLAMKYATDNADELIADLSLDFHKARQASITKEIIEILSGSSQ